MWSSLLAVAPILTQLGKELGLARSELGLVFSVPVLTLAILAPVGGLLADKIGPRKTGTIGMALIGLGGALRGFSNDLGSLLAYCVVFGVGWGLSLPNLPKVVGGWFERKTAGTATGIYSTGIYVGAGLATAVALSDSWRTSLVLWGAFAALASLAWWALIRDPPAPQSAPIRLGRGLRNRRLWALAGTFFLGANVTFYTLTGWLPEILSDTAPAGTTTFIASLLSFFAAPATLVIPLVSDRVRRRRPFLLAACLAGSAASYLLFNGSVGLQTAAVAVLGVSISAIFVICLTLPAELFDRNLVGSASGFMLLAYTGGVIGPWLSGLTQDVTGSFFPTMVMLIASFLASAALATLLPETGGTSRSI